MKKILKSIILFLMIVCFAFGSVACKPETADGGDDPGTEQDQVREDTDNYIVLNRSSQYKILLSAQPSEPEVTAANQIIDYIAKCSGAVLKRTNESEENATTKGYYISIGKTNLYKKQNFKAENLNQEGFILKTVDNTLFIVGEQDCGTVFGAYDFLEKQFGIKFLSGYYEHVPTVSEKKLSKFDDVEIPSFAHRTYFYKLTQDVELSSKFRFYQTAAHMTKDEDALKWGNIYAKDAYLMSMNQIVRYQDNVAEHKEWWSPTSYEEWMQPCWSNSFNLDGTPKSGDTYYNQFVKELFDKIMNSDRKKSYVFLGQEDNGNFCSCKDCIELKNAFGGQESALWVLFANTISTEIKQKLREAGNPQDDLMFGIFAYAETEMPPTHQDEQGNYVADNPLVVVHDDVYVQVAPTKACYMHAINDANCNVNKIDIYAKMQGWRAICKNFAVFQYGTNFNGLLIWYPHESCLTDYFRYWRSIGVNDYLIQGISISEGYYQADLNCYVFSKLMWDVDRNITDIVHEFNRYMFGEKAGAYIDDFYTYMNTYFMSKAMENENSHLGINLATAPWLYSTDTLSKKFIYGAYEFYNKAVAAIENDETFTQTQKDQYLYNLKKVKVNIMYMQYKVYDTVWATTDEARFEFMLEFFDLCDEVELIRFGEGMPVDEARKDELGDL